MASPLPSDAPYIPRPGAAEVSLTTTLAEVNLAHLRHNVRVLQRHAAEAALMGVVKADAYGHGAVRVATTLREEGVRQLAVATVPEGARLREAGIGERILVFAAPLPGFLPAYVRHDLEVTVPSEAVAEAVMTTAREVGPLRVHVKIDTGMGRIGLSPGEAPAVLRRLAEAPGVTLAGIWTHLATADDADNTFARVQLQRFLETLSAAPAFDVPVHAANSAALLRLPESVRAFKKTWARTGIALYGVSNAPELAEEAGLRPVMRFTSRVIHVKVVEAGTSVSYGRTWRAPRRTRIATVGAGYADGYPRLLSNRGAVGVRGRRYAVAGTICMDMFMVDLGDPEGPGAAVAVGDEVVLFGEGGPSALEVAQWAQTIPYEICCSVGARVPRRYHDARPDPG